MTFLYKENMDDMMYTLIQIAKYYFWLKDVLRGKIQIKHY